MLIIGGSSPPADETEAREREETLEFFRRNQRSPEEVARMVEGRRPFSYEEWQRLAPPATTEELAEMEDFLAFLDGENPEFGRSVPAAEEAA